MSLLNDMLQDLLKQPDGDAEVNDESIRMQLNESGMIKTTSIPWVATILSFAVVLLLLLFVKFVYKKDTHKDFENPQFIQSTSETRNLADEKNNTQRPGQYEVANSTVKTSDYVPVQQNLQDGDSLAHDPDQVSKVSGALTARVPQSQEQQPQEHQPQELQPQVPPLNGQQPQQAERQLINTWLQLARQAIARDRLTSPFEDNAYSYYQQVLTLDPQNLIAQQGILQLADRYLAMADKKLTAGDRESAAQLFQRAKRVAPDYERVRAFNGELQQDVAQEKTADANTINANSVVEPVVNKPQARTGQESGSYRIRDPFPIVSENSSLSVTPNAQWLDQEQAQQAQLLLQQAKQPQAILMLEDFIANHEQAVQSTRLLLEIYCQQQQVDAVQQLLASSTALDKTDQHYFKARLALMNNQLQEATDLLEAELPAAEHHEQYRALLAGVYQKSAHYPQAASSYKRLLEVFGEKPAYWLGYALALDAMEQKASALQAYQRLSEYTGLQTEVRHYIEQRIAALRG